MQEVQVEMAGIAQCWCQGFNIGYGKVLHASARSKHAQKEWEKLIKSTTP